MPEADWRAGWWAAAEAIASPNHGARPTHTAIDLVVVHSISLPPGEYGSDAIERLFTNRLDWDAHPYFQSIRGIEVSAHFVVRRNGHVQQFVSTLDRAWHAGRSTWRGRENCNDFSVGIELEGLEGQTFESGQYSALTRLCRALVTQHPLVHIAGHEHIAPGRKLDPGPGFDWPRLRRELGWSRACFPEATNGDGNDPTNAAA
jgi:AmpD protein